MSGTGIALFIALLLCSSARSLGDGESTDLPVRQAPAVLLLRKFEGELLRKLPLVDSGDLEHRGKLTSRSLTEEYFKSVRAAVERKVCVECRGCGEAKAVDLTNFSPNQIKRYVHDGMKKLRPDIADALPFLQPKGPSARTWSEAIEDPSREGLLCRSCARLAKQDANLPPQGVQIDLWTGKPIFQNVRELCLTREYHNHVWRFPYFEPWTPSSSSPSLSSSSSSSSSSSPSAPPSSAPAASVWVVHPEALLVMGAERAASRGRPPASIEPGLRYFPNFLDEAEQQRVLDIVDGPCLRSRAGFDGEDGGSGIDAGRGQEAYLQRSHTNETCRRMACGHACRWSKAVRRRQQFYGQVYYHTSHADARLQPAQAGSGTNEPESKPDKGAGTNAFQAYDISQFDWLVDKLCHPFWAGPPPARDSKRIGAHESEGRGVDDEGSDEANEKSSEQSEGNYVFGKDKSRFPTQILVNEYLENFGISSHFEDEEAFGDVIATISLVQPLYMTLDRPTLHNNQCQDVVRTAHTVVETCGSNSTDTGPRLRLRGTEVGNNCGLSGEAEVKDGPARPVLGEEATIKHEIKVLLEPRSLFVISGDCRFGWRHGISRHKNVVLPPGAGVMEAEWGGENGLVKRKGEGTGCRATLGAEAKSTPGTAASCSTANATAPSDHTPAATVCQGSQSPGYRGYRRISLTIRHLLPGRRQVSTM